MRLVALGVVCLLLSACCRRTPAPLPLEDDAFPSGSASALPPGGVLPEAPEASRCTPPKDTDIYTFGESQGATDDEIGAFGVEIGEGVATPNGFALGALQPTGKTTAAVVLLLDPNGANPVNVKMGLALGDTPAPRVTVRGEQIFASLLESGPSGRHMRIGRIEKGTVAWGPTFDQGRDESLAFDLAIGAKRAVAVWDDDETKPDRGVIRLATFSPETLAAPTVPRTVTLPQTDAESPRIVRRAGGFWLVYVARRPEPTDDSAREQAEAAENRWLEALLLDENGVSLGLPRRITSEKGHVLAFALRDVPGDDGKAVLVFRDDDLPSGAGGGSLSKIVLTTDGASSAVPLGDTDSGAGVPTLLHGWLATADVSSRTRLGKIDPLGELDGKLEQEPVFGMGIPLAAQGDRILVQRPVGRAVRLFVTTCH
jgi:hypothetical protein